MKKNYLLIAIGLLCAVTMQAQKKVVASLDFDDPSQKGAFKTTWAVTPDLGLYGDWVNYQDGDVWSEECTDEPHSGEYCFMAANTGEIMATWNRGFKLSFPMKLETPYRVSFWAKVDPECEGTSANGDNRAITSSELTSWLSKGMENYDKSILSYGMDHMNGPKAGVKFNGEWQHVSYVVYNPTAEAMDATIPNWQGTGKFPAEFGGDGEETWRDHFNNGLPEVYFFIANMFCPVTYYLDDIVIEENVTVREVTHSEQIIKVDFGYATNMATLAKGTDGTYMFDNETVQVLIDDEEAEIVSVEGKEDGFLYIFVDAFMYDDSDVKVTFTGCDDLEYSSTARPSSDTESKVSVFGFEDEMAYWEEDIDVQSALWGKPTIQSSIPMDDSFNLKAEDVKEISITFRSEIEKKEASAVLKKGDEKVAEFAAADLNLSDDGKTITVAMPNLADGEYTFAITGLKNNGVAGDVEIAFAVGAAQGSGEIEYAHKSDWSKAETSPGSGTFNVPFGYSGSADGQWYTSTPSAPYSGAGSAPRMMGNTSDKNQGIYMCARPNGDKATLEFGKYAALSGNGQTVADDIDPEEEALWLDAGTYVLSFQMADWDTSRTPKLFKSGIFNADETPLEEWDEPAPTVTIGPQPPYQTDDIPTTEHEFTVATPGYYYVGFANADKNGLGYEAWLLRSLQVYKRPSAAAYYSKKLQDAIDIADEVVTTLDEKYDGAAKEALAASVKKAKEGSFTNPKAVNDMVKELQAAGQKVEARKTNYDNFVKNYDDAKEKYASFETKYKKSDLGQDDYKKAEAVIKKYNGVDPKSLSDEELIAAANDLKSVPSTLDQAKTMVDILTFRAMQAANLGDKLLIDEGMINALKGASTDDAELVDKSNKVTTLALYEFIDGGVDLSEFAAEPYKSSSIDDEGWDETNPDDPSHDAEGHIVYYSGIDMTGYIKNPNFYTTNTDASVVDFPGWTLEGLEYNTKDEDGNPTTATGSAKMNKAATEANPVVTAMLNAFGESAEYKFYQVIEGLPAGEYIFYIGSRTANKNNSVDGETGIFNAQNTEGVWDKYIFAQVDDEAPLMAPFAHGGSVDQVLPSSVYKVKIKDGQKLTIGAVENYTSGKASGHDVDPDTGDYVAADFWATNTYVQNAKLFYYAPLEGYDYKKAAEAIAADIATEIESVDAASAQNDGVIYNVSGQQVDENYKGIVIINGKKYLQK